MVVEGLVKAWCSGCAGHRRIGGYFMQRRKRKALKKNREGNRCVGNRTKEEGTDLCMEVLLLKLWPSDDDLEERN